MHGEQRRNERRAPHGSRSAEENEQQQYRRCRMDDEVRHMMAAGLETIHLDVGHVRQPGERTTCRIVRMREGPPHVIGAQSSGDVWILDDEFEVVVMEKSKCLTGANVAIVSRTRKAAATINAEGKRVTSPNLTWGITPMGG
jgi:hypothetical protein